MKLFSRHNSSESITKDERIKRIIFDYERQSEVLVSWMQLFVICVYIFTYSMVPEPTYENYNPFLNPISWLMVAYIGFTVFRLYKAYHGRLNQCLISFSIIFDITTLALVSYAIHIQYEVEMAYVLKTGNVIYFLVYVALRALCFQARWVILAGIYSAIAWSSMIAYAIYSLEAPVPVSNLSEYVASPNIMLNVEIDKVAVILLITLIISIGLKRSRSLLIQSVKRQISTADLSRFFAPQVAQKITSSEQELKPGEGHVSRAAILFLDLRNFSKFIHLMDPNEALELIQSYQQKFVPVIQKHHGCIDKFMGDGILASFGAVDPSETYAADCVRAMLEISDVFNKWKEEEHFDEKMPPLNISMAMAVGPVVFGITGIQSRLEYTIIGDTVNLAAKLEKQTRTEQVQALTTKKCFNEAKQQGLEAGKEFRILQARQIPAIDETLDLVVIE